MKFITKIPLENKDKTNQLLSSGWSRLKEPKNIGLVILYSLPISFLLVFLNGMWFYSIYSDFRKIFETSTLEVEFHISLIGLAGIFMFVFVHEMIHGLLIPGVFHSKKSWYGFNALGGFVYTEEVIGMGRYLIISIMPLLILSFLLPAVLAFWGMLNGFVMFCCVLNAAGACIDILNMILTTSQIPMNGKIVNNGLATFYRV